MKIQRDTECDKAGPFWITGRTRFCQLSGLGAMEKDMTHCPITDSQTYNREPDTLTTKSLAFTIHTTLQNMATEGYLAVMIRAWPGFIRGFHDLGVVWSPQSVS